MADFNHIQEADILSRYLIGQSASQKEKQLYSDALTKLRVALSASEEKLWTFMMQHRWAIPLVDAALAAENSSSSVRRRIFIMLAILEASPRYCNYFLPQQRSLLYMVTILFVVTGAIARRITGILLLKLI